MGVPDRPVGSIGIGRSRPKMQSASGLAGEYSSSSEPLTSFCYTSYEKFVFLRAVVILLRIFRAFWFNVSKFQPGNLIEENIVSFEAGESPKDF